MNNLNRREDFSNAAGVVVLLTLTCCLQAAFFLPRMICVMDAMTLLWNPSNSPNSLQEILYEGFDFLFALLAAALAMAAGRIFVPRARRSVMILGAASVIFFYSVLTILMQGRLPAYFFPIYLDLSAAIPGWLIGYYLASGRETWESFGIAKITAVFAPASVVVAAVVIAPWYMPFYVAAQRPVFIGSTFHPVPMQQNAGSSFTPAPISGSAIIPSFHSVQPNGQ